MAVWAAAAGVVCEMHHHAHAGPEGPSCSGRCHLMLKRSYWRMKIAWGIFWSTALGVLMWHECMVRWAACCLHAWLAG